MTNSYSTCVPNPNDPENSFKSCNSPVMDGKNMYYAIKTVLNNIDSAKLYEKEKNFFTTPFTSKNSLSTKTASSNNNYNNASNIQDPGTFTGLGNGTWDYNAGQVTLAKMDNEIIKRRSQMDAKISQIYNSKNTNNTNDGTLLYNSNFYVNMLWIILATTLIYYIFTELR